MADNRSTELPLGDQIFGNFIWNAFFDRDVQKVLETRKEIEPSAVIFPHKGTNSFLRAWPILAYKAIIGAAYWTEEAADGHFFTFYSWDQDFIANLFSAVTHYKTLPESKWDLRRALAECPRQFQSEETQRLMRDMTAGSIPKEGIAIKLQEPYSFKEIVDMISENLPHLKTTWLNAENMRKKTFYEERHRREKILNDWELNFDSYPKWEVKLYESDFDFSSLQYLPGQKYYRTNPSPKTA